MSPVMIMAFTMLLILALIIACGIVAAVAVIYKRNYVAKIFAALTIYGFGIAVGIVCVQVWVTFVRTTWLL